MATFGHCAKYCYSFSEAAAGKAGPVVMEDVEVRAGVVGRRRKKRLLTCVQTTLIGALMTDNRLGREDSRGVDKVDNCLSVVLRWVVVRPLGMRRGYATIARMSLRQSARSFKRQSLGRRLISSAEPRFTSLSKDLPCYYSIFNLAGPEMQENHLRGPRAKV